MIYTTKRLRLGKTERLDYLAHQAGETYSRTLVLFLRILRHKGIYLSRFSMEKLVKNRNLSSNSVQRIIEDFYLARRSWLTLRRRDINACPPSRRRWYHSIPFKESSIRLIAGTLVLSTGRGNNPVIIPWRYKKPKFCSISFNGKEYILNATYTSESEIRTTEGECAGIDLGEIHPAVVDTGSRTIIANGRILRSKRRYQNKVKAHFQSKMDKCKKKSRKWKRLNKAKCRTLNKLNNQINDILHKQTTAIVCAMCEDGVQKVGIGNVKDLRRKVDYGPKANQRIHQMPSGITRKMITYKARREGMTVELVDESYSSQTCPKCGARNKTSNRIYKCNQCGLEHHRDAVGAINIRSKTKYREYVPVVGDMTPPVGIRYSANNSCTSAAKTV